MTDKWETIYLHVHRFFNQVVICTFFMSTEAKVVMDVVCGLFGMFISLLLLVIYYTCECEHYTSLLGAAEMA